MCCVPGGQGIGIPLYLSGALGLIAEVCAPYIQQLFLGLDTITNGYGAMAIGFRLISKWPAGTIAGIVCIAIGAATAFVGFNDVTEGILGDNLIKDVWGMSEDSYQTLSFALNVLSTVATITGNVLNSSLTSKPIKPNKVPDGTAQPKPIKQTDVTTDAVKTGKGVNNPKVKDAAMNGQKAHAYAREHSFEIYGIAKEDTEKTIKNTITGKKYGRADAIDFDNKIIYELKPNNPKAIERAKKQLKRYIEGVADVYKLQCTGKIVTYDIVDGQFIFKIIELI